MSVLVECVFGRAGGGGGGGGWVRWCLSLNNNMCLVMYGSLSLWCVSEINVNFVLTVITTIKVTTTESGLSPTTITTGTVILEWIVPNGSIVSLYLYDYSKRFCFVKYHTQLNNCIYLLIWLTIEILIKWYTCTHNQILTHIEILHKNMSQYTKTIFCEQNRNRTNNAKAKENDYLLHVSVVSWNT